MAYFNIVLNLLSVAFGWFTELMTHLGMLSYVIGGFTFAMICKFLLSPLFGQAVADNAASNLRSIKASRAKVKASKVKSSKSSPHSKNK